MIEDKINTKENEVHVDNSEQECSNPDNLADRFLYLVRNNQLKPVSGEIRKKCQKELDELAAKQAYGVSKAMTYFVD